MANRIPVVVDILDAESALDSEASFTGEKKLISEVGCG